MAIKTIKAPATKFSLAYGRPFDLNAYRGALSVSGYAAIALDFADKGEVLLKLVNQLSLGAPHSHDHSGRQVWDVKYDSSIDQQTGTRSHTLREFPMHTDASFEVPPPQYVALYVVHEDRLGGGITQLLDSKSFWPALSLESKETLSKSFFTITVPAEFRQFAGQETVSVPLLDAFGNFRFRHELLVFEKLSPMQLTAVDELQLLLNNEQWFLSFNLPRQTILLIDNGRMFHARTRVLDSERHLLRMRFD